MEPQGPETQGLRSLVQGKELTPAVQPAVQPPGASLLSPRQIAQTAPYPTARSDNLRSRTCLHHIAQGVSLSCQQPPGQQRHQPSNANNAASAWSGRTTRATRGRMWHAAVTGWCKEGHENNPHGSQHAGSDEPLHHSTAFGASMRHIFFFKIQFVRRLGGRGKGDTRLA